MVRLPVVRVLVEQVAELPESATAVQPLMALLLSVKLTEPVGLVPLTVAVNVTLFPVVDGLAELPTVVVVAVGGSPLAQASTSVRRE